MAKEAKPSNLNQNNELSSPMIKDEFPICTNVQVFAVNHYYPKRIVPKCLPTQEEVFSLNQNNETPKEVTKSLETSESKKDSAKQEENNVEGLSKQITFKNAETLTESCSSSVCNSKSVSTSTSDLQLFIKIKSYFKIMEFLREKVDQSSRRSEDSLNTKLNEIEQDLNNISPKSSSKRNKIVSNETVHKKQRTKIEKAITEKTNPEENYSESGFVFLAKGNGESSSQRMVISFISKLKAGNENVGKKKIKKVQNYQRPVNSKTEPQGNDFIELESEPSLMAQVSRIIHENSNGLSSKSKCKNTTNGKQSDESHQAIKSSKPNNEVVHQTVETRSSITEYIFLPDSTRWNKGVSSNILPICDAKTKLTNKHTTQKATSAMPASGSTESEFISMTNLDLSETVESSQDKMSVSYMPNEKPTKKTIITDLKTSKDHKKKKLTFSKMFSFLKKKHKLQINNYYEEYEKSSKS